MNQSFSSDCDSPEKFIEDINIKGLIPEAKPVISPTRQFEKEIPFRPTFPNQQIVSKNPKKGLFKRDGSIKSYPFASNFEGGNLQSVESRESGIYTLRLRQDTNSQHKSGWFYFQVRGLKTATFRIKGFPKPKLLYNQGMKICIKQDGKWSRAGLHINYQQSTSGDYSLQFQHTFQNSEEVSEVAYCFPYTYMHLKEYLKGFCRKHAKFVTRQIIARTILGNDVEALIFSANSSKPIIIVTARVHPSESVGSWIAQGFMQWLVTTTEGQQLLGVYEVRIIPMLNPDGVLRGNHRFSFAGTDLNRRWKKCNQKLHPEIFFTKNFIQQIDSKRIQMIVDLHGHSRKKDVFFYGCEDKNNPDPSAREFPYLLSKISPYFNYNKSCFKVQTSKQGTARIYLWKSLKIPYIYTLQCSMCGLENSKKNFEILDLEKIGSELGRGMHLFLSQTVKEVAQQTKAVWTNIHSEFTSDKNIFHTEECSEGSQSEPSEGELDEQQVIIAIEHYNQSKALTLSKSKINSQTLETGMSKQKTSTYAVADREKDSIQMSTLAKKNFRKRVSTSYHSVRTDRKKLITNGTTRLQHSHTINQPSIQQVNILVPLEGFMEGDLPRPETRSRAQYLHQILGASQGNLADLDIQKRSKMHLQSQLKFPDEFTGSKDLQCKDPIIHNQAIKHGFYGAQYVRVKKYAEKIIKQKQKKQILCIEPRKPGQRTNSKPNGQLKLDVISLQKRLRNEISPLPPSSLHQPNTRARRSSTTNR